MFDSAKEGFNYSQIEHVNIFIEYILMRKGQEKVGSWRRRVEPGDVCGAVAWDSEVGGRESGVSRLWGSLDRGGASS